MNETTQGLDMPDGVGWWAFDGNMRYTTEILHYEIMDSDLVRIEFSDWENGPQLINTKAFRELNPGKWYRLHMPWETPSPVGASVPVPQEVRERYNQLDETARLCIFIMAKAAAERDAASPHWDE